MEWILLLVLAVLVAMGLLAGQKYATPRFAKLQTVQATYAGNVAVTAAFIFVSLLIAGALLHMVDKRAAAIPGA